MFNHECQINIVNVIQVEIELKKTLFQIRLLTISFPSGQYLVRRSASVRGMVKVQRRRLLRARFPIKIFRVVRRT